MIKTKKEIVSKNIKKWSEICEDEVWECMDEYAKQTLQWFGDWKLTNDIEFERGENLGWGNLSYSQMVDKFFKEIINGG